MTTQKVKTALSDHHMNHIKLLDQHNYRFIVELWDDGYYYLDAVCPLSGERENLDADYYLHRLLRKYNFINNQIELTP